MQYFQFVATRADTGAALAGASVAVYLTGTTTLAPLYNSIGGSISNPVTASGTGAVGFAAVNGTYDLAISLGGYSSTIVGVQLYDLSNAFPHNLMNFAGVDPTGMSSSAAAITAWINAGLADGRPLYAPAGTYLDGNRTIDLAPVWGAGIIMVGDGINQTMFNTGGGTWTFYSSGSSGGGGAVFYFQMRDMGYQSSNSNGDVIKLGDDLYTSALNGCQFANLWFKNTAASPAYAGIKCNEVYSSNFFNCTSNSGGYSTTSGSAALRLTQASFNTFQGSFSGSNIGVHLTSNNTGQERITFSSTINGSGVMTVSGAVTYLDGMPAGGLVGLNVQEVATGLPTGTYVKSQLTGALGQAGTYQLANSRGATIPTLGSSTALYGFSTGYSFANNFLNLDCEICAVDVQIDTPNAANNTFIGGEYNIGPLGGGPGSIVTALAGYNNIFLNLRPDLVANSASLVGCVVPTHNPSFGTPTIPASGGSYTNTNLFDLDVYLFGIFSQVSLNFGAGPVNLGATSGTQFVHLNLPAGVSFTPTYSGSVGWLIIPRSTF